MIFEKLKKPYLNICIEMKISEENTESYLADHPEIDRASVEILNEGENQ